MFKNMLKRSWLSLKRKLGRTAILTIVFFMMANLTLTAFIIKTAVSVQMDYAKSTLGGTVSIQADMDTIREGQKTEIEKGGDPSEMFKEMLRPSVNVETADAIVNDYSDYLRDYSYTISTSANSGNLETVETKGFGGGKGGFPGMDFPGQASSSSNDSTLDSDITISGANAYAYIDGVENETITIKEGDYFSEDDYKKALISYEFSELNSLKVGDTFTIKNIYTEKDITLTVIGIYDTSEARANANTIYTNTATAAKFLSTDDYNDGNYAVEDVNFYMANSDAAEEFVTKINEEYSELADNNLKVTIDTSEYDSISSSIEGVGGFADMILIIVIIAAIIIITLIVTINVKDRRYEIGVLMSLGADKKNIIGQIATELIITGTLGFALASITGTVLAGTLGNSILESQTATSTAQSEMNFGRPGASVGNFPGGNFSAPGGSGSRGKNQIPSDLGNLPDDINITSESSTKVELDINAKPEDYLLLFITGYLVILLALVLPSVNIMRYQPKEILSGKE